MSIDVIGPVGITISPPEEPRPAEPEPEPMPEAPPEQPAPLPSYQGSSVDETA